MTKPIICKWCGVACMDYRKGYLAKFKRCKCPSNKARTPFVGQHFQNPIDGETYKAVRIHRCSWDEGGVSPRYAMATSFKPVLYVTYYELKNYWGRA